MPPPLNRVPEKKELSALPHLAMVAFAARCARRVAGYVHPHRTDDEWWQKKRHLEAVVFAERTASTSVRGEEYDRLQKAIGQRLEAIYKALGINTYTPPSEATRFGFETIRAAFRASWYLKDSAAASAEEAARCAVAAYDAAEYSTDDAANEGHAERVADEIRAIWRDFERLRQAAQEENWSDETCVLPRFFGPLRVTEAWEQPKQTNERRAVILTAIRPEFQAVRSHLTDVTMRQHPQGTVYEQGTFTPPTGQPWMVLLVEAAMGNANAALEAERAISFFKPWVALFVGVAGGIKDVKLGDVVAATKLYGYEAGKEGDTFSPRPSLGEASYRLQQLAKYLGRNDDRLRDWLGRVKVLPDGLRPSVFVAPMAAGEKVIASTKSATYEFLRAAYSDAVAVEMEGRGFFQTAFTYPDVLSMVVRGISDVIDGKAVSDAAGYQEVAAATAAAFAMELLSNLRDVG